MKYKKIIKNRYTDQDQACELEIVQAMFNFQEPLGEIVVEVKINGKIYERIPLKIDLNGLNAIQSGLEKLLKKHPDFLDINPL